MSGRVLYEALSGPDAPLTESEHKAAAAGPRLHRSQWSQYLTEVFVDGVPYLEEGGSSTGR